MGKAKHNSNLPPQWVRDHMVSGEDFELTYNAELKAYKTTPAPLNLAPYYDHPEYWSHQHQAKGFMAKAYGMVREFNVRRKLRWLKRAAPNAKKLLDYGCGTGVFLNAAKESGWHVEGVEPNAKAHNIAVQNGLKVCLDRKEVSLKPYDAICLWHVLEHLENPVEMKRWFQEHLSERGVLIIAVPNFKSWDAKHYGAHWAAYDVPRHLWHFSQESIEAIFGSDFSVLKKHPMWFDAFYVSLLSEQYKGGRSNWLNALVVGLWSNLMAIFTKEPSSITYVLKKR